MAARTSVVTPFGEPVRWEIASMGAVLGIWILFTAVGMVFGALYFNVVAQAALFGKVTWREALSQWPWACLQVGLLSLIWVALLLAVFLPFSCFLSVFLFSGIGLEQISLFVILIFAGFLIWMLIPLAFSPHGIFVNRHAMWISILRSIRLTRMTLPTTSLLLLAVLILSEGLDVIWNIPGETSWFTIVGIIGHAFVTSSLLAASFVYYRDASTWAEEVLKARVLSAH